MPPWSPFTCWRRCLSRAPATLMPLLVRSGGQAGKIADGVAAALDQVATLKTPTGDIQPSQAFIRALTLADWTGSEGG